MKTSLIGGLFENLLSAVRYQQRGIRLFEVRPVYIKDEKLESGVREEWRVAAIFCGRSYSHGLSASDRNLDFFDGKGFLELALDTVGCRGLRYMAYTEEMGQIDARLHPAQCAKVAIGKGPCGFIGRLHPKIEAEFKFREPVYLFELSLDRVLEIAKSERKYSAVSKFPKVERDFSFITPKSMSAEKVIMAIQKLGKPLLEGVSVVDLYTGEKIPAGTQSLSVSLVLADPSRTLAETEVDTLSQKILVGLDKELGIKLRVQ